MLKENDVVTFIAHLSVTIKSLTRRKQKVVLAAMLEGNGMPSNMLLNILNISLKCFSSQFSGIFFYVLCQFLASAGFQLIVWSHDL